MIAAACALAFGWATWWLGRDLNWDYFNYHAYAAHQSYQDRLGQDFLAAGLQGYLNPMAYAPLGYMTRSGMSSLAISVTLAAVQSLNLVFLYLVCRELLTTLAHPRLAAALATLLGALTGVLWSQVGSTFVDALISPLVLAAWWIVVRYPQRLGIAGAAALAGAAVALKWTFAPYAAGLLAAVLVLPGTPQARLLRLLTACTTAAAGFLLLYWHWGAALYREFGSPVFPLFNRLFRSPDYPPQSDSFLRFVPDSLWELLTLPWRLVLNEAWVYTEISAPDLRPGLLLLLAGALLLKRALVRVVGTRESGNEAKGAEFHDCRWRVSAVFLLVSLVGWLITSSNGRYGVPLFLSLGPLVWMAIHALFNAKAARVTGLLVICLQAIHLASAGVPRWNAQHWAEELLPAKVPARLVSAPHLMITVGTSSESYVATFVHPDSPFTNPLGMYALANDGPGWSRFVQLREKWAGRTEVLFRSMGDANGPFAQRAAEVVDQMIDRLGLTLDKGKCEQLVFNASEKETAGDRALPQTKRYLLSCPALKKAESDPLLKQRRTLATQIVDALEDRCPKYFRPARPQVEGSRDLWIRRYVQHDLFVHVDFANDAITFKQERQATPGVIGKVSNWRRDVEAFQCRLPHQGARGVATLAGERH